MKSLVRLSQRLKEVATESITLKTGLNLARPSYVCAQLTMKCNSRCMHCDIWKTNFRERELTTEQWKNTLTSLHHWLGEFPMIFTGGESMLRPDTVELVTHAVDLGLKVELLTNGLLLTESLARAIIATGVGRVTISFDGVKDETFDRFRGSGKPGFAVKTRAALEMLNRYRRELNLPTEILIKTVISKNNLDELTEIANYAQENKFKLRYQPIEENYAAKKTDKLWFQKSPLWISDFEALEAQMRRLIELKKTNPWIENSKAEFERYIEYFKEPLRLMTEVQTHNVGRTKNVCRPAVSAFMISSNGDVRMCYMMKPIGNVAMQDPMDLWEKRPRCWMQHCSFLENGASVG